MSEFGDYVKATREEADLSLQDVADRAGLTKAHLWDLEQGRTKNPTVETIVRLAFAFDIEPSKLFMFAEFDCAGRLKVARVQHNVVAK